MADKERKFPRALCCLVRINIGLNVFFNGFFLGQWHRDTQNAVIFNSYRRKINFFQLRNMFVMSGGAKNFVITWFLT